MTRSAPSLLALLLSSALALAAAPSLAADTPAASRFDSRIRFVTYNAADVVTLDTAEGVVTHVVFEEGETVMTFATGDADAWAIKDKANHLFLKPTADHADTNLVVITDRRTYNFWLSYRRAPTPAKGKGALVGGPTTGKESGAIYQLSFHYPDSAAKAKAAASATSSVEDAFKAPSGPISTAYVMTGDRSIAPLNVWDDGRLTYFKFQAQRDLPVIYALDADGSEGIVNRNSAGVASDTIVMQKVSERWRLRLGNQVLTVRNTAMAPLDPEAPIVTRPRYEDPQRYTATSSPNVQRVIKGNSQ